MSNVEVLPAPGLTVAVTRLQRIARRSWRMARTALHLVVGAIAVQLLIVGPNAPLPRAQLRRLQHAVVRWWVRKLCRILHLQLQVRGPLPGRTTLLVTNHVSWLDIPALLSVVNADFVAKRDVVQWPVIGTIATRVGTIFLARGQHNAAKTTADGMTWRLAQRQNVILFPEATTSDGRGVRKFYARLYQAAIRTHSRVQAVAIRYPGLDGAQGAAPFIDDDELLGHLWRLLGEKQIVAELHFCDPLVPDADRRTLANRTRQQICNALGIEATNVHAMSGKMRFPRQKQPARRAAA
jgi:1-acyl-sn-glycerol-3-phosphate acyltransferase